MLGGLEKICLNKYAVITVFALVKILMLVLLYLNYFADSQEVIDITNNIIKLMGYISVNAIALYCTRQIICMTTVKEGLKQD